MTTKRHLTIGLSLTATWRKGVRAPDQADIEASKKGALEYNIRLSKMAEAAKLDFVFKPDFGGGGPTAGKGAPPRASAETAANAVALDPILMLTAVARETEKIGLVTTSSTTFNPPYLVARQVQSLNWISNGRAGWNIVTSIEGAHNFGGKQMPAPEIRYRRAAEFTDVVQRLWQSHPYEALTGDAVPSQIDHESEFFSVRGPLGIASHPAGRIPLFQAGASDMGRNFAASVADAIFGAIPDLASGIELRADLRKRAAEKGRKPDDIRVLPGFYFFLADTRDEAKELHRLGHAHLGRDKRVESVKSIVGLDIAHLQDGDRVSGTMLQDPNLPVRSRTHADLLRRFISENNPTVAELLARPEVVGSAHWVSVGTVDDVIRDIVEWHEAGAIDGMIALPGGSWRSMELFFTELMPRLAEMGLFRKEYEGNTLGAHLGIH